MPNAQCLMPNCGIAFGNLFKYIAEGDTSIWHWEFGIGHWEKGIVT